MNRWLTIPMILMAFTTLAFAVKADEGKEEKHKRIIVKSLGGDTEKVAEIIRELEADPEAGHVFVTVDEDGNVDVDRSEEIEIESLGLPHGLHGMPGRMMRMHRRSEPMSEDAGECILRHLDKARGDAAANLLRATCVSLNPVVEDS